MQEANLLEIAQGLSQLGHAALWLGDEWEAPKTHEDMATVVAKDWIGVWADSTDPRLAQEMESAWRASDRPRQLVQVPNTLEEALGASFRFSDFAPYMYLNGRDGEADPLDPTTRDDSKVDKIRQLARVQGGLLLVAGAADCATAVNTAILAGRRAPDMRRIVILEHDSSTCTAAAEATSDRDRVHVAKMVAYAGGVVDLLREIESLATPTEEQVVRIGDIRVPLVPLLRQEPPITQDYAVLRTSDVSPSPREGEEPPDLLAELVAGSAQPWRSIARGFVWDGRPERDEWRRLLSDAIQRIRSNKNKVVVLDVDVEPGAGTTVLLSQLAVAAAVDGCPTLFHLAVDTGLAYNRLRTFLTDLYRTVSGPNAMVPAVLVFDVDSYWTDVYGHLDSLPYRLNRDGRRAVIIRAHQTSGFWADNYKQRRSTQDIHYFQAPSTLRDRVSDPVALGLANWMAHTYKTINDDDSLPSDWYRRFEDMSREAGCPLLVAMSLLLVEKYREGARLGDRLVGRLQRVVDAIESDRRPSPPKFDDGITGRMRRLEFGLAKAVRADDFYSLAIVLAAMSSLRVTVPQRVATRLAGIDPAEALNVITMLDRVGLVTPREPASEGLWSSSGEPYRTKPPSIQLAHHAYGPMLLGALVTAKVERPSVNDLASALLDEATDAGGDLGAKTLSLLRPILTALRPGNEEDRDFAEQVVQRFLRVQREKSPERDGAPATDDERTFRRWQWAIRNKILEAFDWVPEELLKTSASILHSRAITAAKCTWHERPDEARSRYMQAEDDLIAALEMNSESRSDNPAFMLNTLGGVYVHWSRMEREHGDPQGRASELSELAEDTLREAKAKQPDSAYPLYYLALHKVETARHLLKADADGNAEDVGACLAEALELLSGEPEPRFRAQWDELFAAAVNLLGEQGVAVIASLKENGKHLGWALEALHELNGEFPRERSPEVGEPELAKAWQLIEESFQAGKGDAPPIAHLLRYSVFSVRDARLSEPAYDVRFRYLEPVVGTKYFDDDPVLQFDYGMLLFQNGDFERGADVFRDLRRGQRFFYVPSDRATTLTQGPNRLEPKEFQMQVQNVDSRTGQGWARVGYPVRIPTPVPFGVRAFEGRDYEIKPRATLPCNITIRPAGPFAEPVVTKW
ncbi:MAG: hypothetical protein WD468_00445 [Pirellulales bacterium]